MVLSAPSGLPELSGPTEPSIRPLEMSQLEGPSEESGRALRTVRTLSPSLGLGFYSQVRQFGFSANQQEAEVSISRQITSYDC